jgi:hypothetical protein
LTRASRSTPHRAAAQRDAPQVIVEAVARLRA